MIRSPGLMLCLLISVSFASANIDQRLFLTINGARCTFFDGASVVLSDLPTLPVVIYGYSLGYGHYNHRRSALNFGKIGLTNMAAVVVTSQCLKAIVHRERPKTTLAGAQGDYADGFFSRLIPSEKYALPSQSAALAFSSAVIFGYAYPSWEKYFFLLAALNGWARIYRGAHYPGDIVAGAVLGTAVTYAALAVFKNADSDFDIRKNPPRLPLFAVARTF